MRVRRVLSSVLLFAGVLWAGCTPPEGNFPDPPISRPTACAPDNPTGVCEGDATCREGQCVDNALFCSSALPDGLCASSQEQCIDGACQPLSALCSEDNLEGLCAGPLDCINGRCATDAPCAPDEPLGFCELGFGCLDGGCVSADQLCSLQNDTGLCPTGAGCLDGSCTDDALLCSAGNPGGLCPNGSTCVSGSCAGADEICSATNPAGRCPAGQSCNDGVCGAPDCGCEDNETCLDGFCRDDSLLCGPSNPVGLCSSGFDCLNGECVDAGASCSSANPTGVCPAGQVCESGECIALDGEILCNDDNPCTQDFFDPDRNRCGHAPQAASCSDGNACTTDVCGDGVCEATPIGGCLEPPSINEVVSPTNIGELILTGDKPAGAAVVINDATAVPENPETSWTVTMNLTPGENTFVIFTDDGGTRSETREVVVVYDITPPGLNITPAGGQFLNGVTVTVAADEPARVYYTTDGSDPDLASPSFQSLKQLRVFDATELRFLVEDQAGNLSEEIFTASFEVTSADNGWRFATDLQPEALIFAGAAFDYTEDRLYVVGGSDGNAPQAGAYVLDPETDSWTTLPSMVDARSQLALTADDGRVIAIGGEKEGTPLNRVEVLEIDSGAGWVQKTPMPSTRFSAVAVHVGSEIFVLGGEANGGAVVTNLEVYDPVNDTWDNQRAQMPRARKAFGAIPHGNLIYLVGGVGADGAPVAEVDIYNVDADTWTQGASLPNPRGFAAVFKHENRGAVTGNYVGVVIAGGRDGAGNGSVLVDEYILDEDRWLSRTPLDQPRHSGAGHEVIVPGLADVFDGQGWIIGGQLPSGVTETIVAFDAPQDFVRRLPDLPEPRFMHAAVAHDDRIYLLGGRDFSETKKVLVFDPETETYEAGTDLPTFQSGLVAASVAGRIYAIGGSDNFGNAVATVHAYDPAARIWQLRRPMPTSRRDAAVATFGEQVWVIGGENNGALQTVEIYDPDSDTWAASTALPFPLKGAHATVYNDQVFVLGGERADGTLFTGMLRYNGSSWTEQSLLPNFNSNDGVTAFGKMVRTGPDTVALLGGRAPSTIQENIWTINLSTREVSSPYGLGSNLIDAVDFAAATFLNGSVYLFGGNTEDPVGSQGSVRAFKVDARCLDGVQNGREETGGFDEYDHGGGCGFKAIGHSVTLGGGNPDFFFNQTSSSFSQTTAQDACRHVTGGFCARVSTSCSVTPGGLSSCSFNDGDFLVFQYCSTVFFNSNQNVAGNIYRGCTDEVVGTFE